jgi:hypothetical protein
VVEKRELFNFKQFLFMMCLLISPFLKGQVTIAYQGFEGNASDTWGFTPPFQNLNLPQVLVGASNYGVGYAAVGNNSMRIGGGSTTCGNGSANCINNALDGANCGNNKNGLSLELQAIDIPCYNNVNVSVAYRTHVLCSGEGQGLDSGDNIYFEVSLNGAAFVAVSTVNGFNNCNWIYTSASVGCAGPAVPNPFVYSVPIGTKTIAFRVRLRVDRADEVLYLDDIKLTGEPSGDFNYPPILCVSNSNPVLPILDYNLLTDGTETFSITPATGLNININSGIIIPSLSTPGTYQIEYVRYNETCATTSVTINGNVITSPIYHN